MKALFDKLSESYANTYSLTDHFDVDEIIWSEIIVIFKEYIPKTQTFWYKSLQVV